MTFAFLNRGFNFISTTMQIFRQYITPFIVVIIFLLAMVAVSARIFLPGDLAAPAPTEELNYPQEQAMLYKPNVHFW